MYENAARSVAMDESAREDGGVWEGCIFPHKIRGRKASRSRRQSSMKSIISVQGLGVNGKESLPMTASTNRRWISRES